VRALTDWRWQREGQVRTWKQSDQARGTHRLEIAEGGISQDMERKQPSKGHSQTGDGRGRDKSGHRKKVTKKGALTSWRGQWDGKVSTWEENRRMLYCSLSCQHSLPGDSRERDKSEHRKKVTK